MFWPQFDFIIIGWQDRLRGSVYNPGPEKHKFEQALGTI